MSALESTTTATMVAIVAVGLLVVADRFKTFRPMRLMLRGRRRGAPVPVTVVHEETLRYRPAPWWRKLLSVGVLGATGVALGVILAVLVAVTVIGGLLLLSGFGT